MRIPQQQQEMKLKKNILSTTEISFLLIVSYHDMVVLRATEVMISKIYLIWMIIDRVKKLFYPCYNYFCILKMSFFWKRRNSCHQLDLKVQEYLQVFAYQDWCSNCNHWEDRLDRPQQNCWFHQFLLWYFLLGKCLSV